MRTLPPDAPECLLDFGYHTAKERRQAFEQYRRCGRIDAVTRQLVMEPVYKKWEGSR